MSLRLLSEIIRRSALSPTTKWAKRKGTIDPDRINRELITFFRYVQALYPNARIQYIDCDNASQELINGIRLAFIRANIPVVVRDCWKGLINDRIYALNGLMTQGRFCTRGLPERYRQLVIASMGR